MKWIYENLKFRFLINKWLCKKLNDLKETNKYFDRSKATSLEKINEIINQEGGSFNTTYKITDNIYELINTIQNNKNSNIFKINIAKEIIKDHFLRLYNEYNNIYINLLVQPNKIINIDILKQNLIDFDYIPEKLGKLVLSKFNSYKI
jgi:homospermidine synthase